MSLPEIVWLLSMSSEKIKLIDERGAGKFTPVKARGLLQALATRLPEYTWETCGFHPSKRTIRGTKGEL